MQIHPTNRHKKKQDIFPSTGIFLKRVGHNSMMMKLGLSNKCKVYHCTKKFQKEKFAKMFIFGHNLLQKSENMHKSKALKCL